MDKSKLAHFDMVLFQAAAMSKESEVNLALSESIDLYRHKASKHFGVDYDDVTDAQRKEAKRLFWMDSYTTES